MRDRVRRGFSARMLAFAGAVVVSLLALACAPAGTGGGGGGSTPTTSTTTTLPWSTPTGDVFLLDMTCYGSVFGTYFDFPQSGYVIVDAPDVVGEGDLFDIWVTPGVWDVPYVLEGYTVLNVNSFTIRLPLPANTTWVDGVLTNGFDMGPGYPSIGVQNGDIVYRVPGPFTPGTSPQLPRMRITLQASGAPGSQIQTTMRSLSNAAAFELGTVGTACTENTPNRVFTTTTVII